MPTGPNLVAVLGRGVVAADGAVVRADDLGLTRGDGCFDATRVTAAPSGEHGTGSGYLVHHWRPHLARFARSARALGLSVDQGAWQQLLEEALNRWAGPGESGEAALKVMLSGGPEHAAGKPQTGILTLTPLGREVIAARSGITAITLQRGHPSDLFVAVPWLLGGVKTLSYAINRAATREAAARGVDDAIWVSTDGYLLEGPTSSLLIRHGNTLTSTPVEGTGVLASVTIQVIFGAVSSCGWSTAYRLVTPSALRHADGAWLVSAVRGLAPLLAVDGHALAHDPEATGQLARLAGW